LSNKFDIVVADSKYSMNIGSTARIMSCFGFNNLNLVSPICEHTNMEARTYALFGEKILNNAKIYNSLEEYKNDEVVLFAFTRRLGTKRRNPIQLSELDKVLNRVKTSKKVALVFGGESSGLSNEQVAVCDYIVTIDKDLVSNSLSLPTAICVVLFKIKEFISKNNKLAAKEKQKQKAFFGQMNALLGRVKDYLMLKGFIDNKDSDRTMVVLEKILNKLELNEIRLIHAAIRGQNANDTKK